MSPRAKSALPTTKGEMVDQGHQEQERQSNVNGG